MNSDSPPKSEAGPGGPAPKLNKDRRQTLTPAQKDATDELLIVSVVTADCGEWEERRTLFGTREQLSRIIDLNSLPPGAKVFWGAAAREFLYESAKHEARYQRERFNGRN